MRYFAVWKEKERIEVIEPTIPIENALYWHDAKTELSIYLKIIPENARVINAKNFQDAREKFAEYEKEEAGQ